MKATIRNLRTPDDLADFQRWLGQSRSALAIDLETSGFGWYGPDRIRTAQFGDAETGWVLTYDDWRGVVRHTVATYEGPIVGHNVGFDLHFLCADLGLTHNDLPWHRIHDTMLMAQMVDPTRPKGLKPLSARFISPEAVAGQSQLDDDMRRGGWGWDTVPVDLPSYRFYAGLDTVLTVKLFELFDAHIDRTGSRRAYELEQVAQHPLFAMECHGMQVDTDYVATTKDALRHGAEKLLAQARSEYGLESLMANAQIMERLRADGWTPKQFTEKGNPQLTAEILGRIDHPLARLVTKYRLANKFASTWLDAFINKADADGIVYPSIHQVAARTGRMSVTNPPLQTLPREREDMPSIRDSFVPREGHSLISADFAQVEARVFAHHAAEEGMLRTIAEGRDLHRFAAAQAYGIAEDEVTKEQRQIAKSVTFAKLYGAGPAKIAETAGITEAEARDFVDRYDAAFPGVKRFQRRIIDNADEARRGGGRAEVTTYLGSKLAVGDDEPTYRLCNYKVQGDCALVLKDRIVSLHNAGLTDYMILPIHDEVLFEVAHDEAEDLRVAVAEAMPDNHTFAVPLAVEVSPPAERWGQAK